VITHLQQSIHKASGAKVVKRKPLLHPAIPSPYASAENAKVVYVKYSTPFMSAVHRVQRLLLEVEKRGSQSIADRVREIKGDRILAAASASPSEVYKEEITIKGSGRAIEKVMNLAAWFGQRETELGIQLRLATGTVSAIDDIEIDEDEISKPSSGPEDVGTSDVNLPETRVRQVSVLEVRISHK
jgi:ribonuclease P/MRP protein subunit POP7